MEKPDLSKISIRKRKNKIRFETELFTAINKADFPKYLYWDKVKYMSPPLNLSSEEFWLLIKEGRKASYSRTTSILINENGEKFSWQTLPNFQHFLHKADLELGGSLGISRVIDEKNKKKFIIKGVIEEAIASSQLEGANTTRKVAKEMIKTKRKPKTHSEQMIFNNFVAMSMIEQEMKTHKLSKHHLLYLHEILTKDTIEKEDIGRFRTNADKIVVADRNKDIIYHTPPDETFLQNEIMRFIAYANDDLSDEAFVHPVIKAIILHFWIGYLHPFTDGNGRLARALFYWYLLRKDYWAFTCLPLSKVIKMSPSQYRDAYTYTEQDDCDLTYFIDYNIRKIIQAKDDFDKYIAQKITNIKIINEKYKLKYKLNDRQTQLLFSYHKNSNNSTYIKLHANYHDVGRLTARKDLLHLKGLGFVKTEKIGKEVHYFPTEKVGELFE